ncbi:hypothetical protein [Tychonema sp. LEGE 07203]|uniref:hypothetical protein n=1 Tax=Tychonema sp. LEGE 07203 TaxID=1828671 RepID=UPI0018812947|nr:hypothetical protein [Tychonema sp. LEGE 07203]MBE9096262.1 hypothetical protein [Tychonema sp. LEGE 07203]
MPSTIIIGDVYSRLLIRGFGVSIGNFGAIGLKPLSPKCGRAVDGDQYILARGCALGAIEMIAGRIRRAGVGVSPFLSSAAAHNPPSKLNYLAQVNQSGLGCEGEW